MTIAPGYAAAIQALGYTPDEARFLYVVATHSGYFVPRQFIAFVHVHWGKRSDSLVKKLMSRGHASWREYLEVGGVYHLVSHALYQGIGKPSLRNRRRHAAGFIQTRLLLLDFVLQNMQHQYLETEDEKLSYFCDQLGVRKGVLPAKRYAASSQTTPNLRYFVDRFPLFLDASDNPTQPLLTFTFVDAGLASLAGLAHHVRAYKPLFGLLPHFQFLYIAYSPVHFTKAERCFSLTLQRPASKSSFTDLGRYFKLRKTWEDRKYALLADVDLEFLKWAQEAFRDSQLDAMYEHWKQQSTDDCPEDSGRNQIEPSRAIFRCCLVNHFTEASLSLEKTG